MSRRGIERLRFRPHVVQSEQHTAIGTMASPGPLDCAEFGNLPGVVQVIADSVRRHRGGRAGTARRSPSGAAQWLYPGQFTEPAEECREIWDRLAGRRKSRRKRRLAPRTDCATSGYIARLAVNS